MFRSKKKMQKICQESRKVCNKAYTRRSKMEGNSNMPGLRMTIPPGFLTGGIKSKLVKKTENNYHQTREFERKILEEDLHGFLYEGPSDSSEEGTKLRRSSRLYHKKLKTDPKTASQYYNNIVKTITPPSETRDRKKSILKCNSKSIFKEIQDRLRISDVNYVDNPESFVASQRHYSVVNKNFNKELFKQTNLDFTFNTLNHISGKLCQETLKVNRILSGKEEPVDTDYPIMNSVSSEYTKQPDTSDFPLVPPHEWVFKTPPRHKAIVTTKVDECQIQPALLCTTQKQKNIYELKNKNANVDLSNYCNRQEIDVDTRFMKHVATFNSMDDDVKFTELGRDPDAPDYWSFRIGKGDYRNLCEEPLVLKKEPVETETCQEINNYFMSLTCRPKKTVKKMSRVGSLTQKNIFKPGTSQPEPGCSSFFDLAEETEMDYTVIQEDDGEMNLVATQQAKRFKFNFDPSPTNCDEQSHQIFTLNDSPNLFDFGNL